MSQRRGSAESGHSNGTPAQNHCAWQVQMQKFEAETYLSRRADMATKIAHLSDLHYQGRGFNEGQWRAACRFIAKYGPDLLIVSGDLIDHPDEAQLRAIKAELTKLAEEAGAQLFVVPGNHDLFSFGTDIRQGRDGAFDQVFPGIVKPAAPTPTATRGRVFNWLTRGHRGQPAPGGAPPDRKLTREPEGIPVLLALLDSNAADRLIAFAGGSIDENDLVILGGDLDEIKRAYLVRIAVIHHHVLPIAYTGGQIVGAEPLMVLQNAGTLLSTLARHRFDLVLHGHKHRQQFSRIDFEPETAEGYPIAVAAAGSPAMTSRNDPRGNSFNLIEVEDNGRITVKSLFYGAAAEPNPDGREGKETNTYVEPISMVKRRAFVRARERHKILCEERHTRYEITENGDLIAATAIRGLRSFGGIDIYQRRHIAIVQHGRVVADLRLDDESFKRGYRIKQDGLGYWVVLPESLARLGVASYEILQAGANCMMMTLWEAQERVRSGSRRLEDAEEEWVGVRIAYPIEKLIIDLKLPDGLGQVQPYLRCIRYDRFPDYGIENCDATFVQDLPWHIDNTMSGEEGARLGYRPEERIWRVSIERPMVGFGYHIRWKVPGSQPDVATAGQTFEWRRMLLSMGGRIASRSPTPADTEAQLSFGILREALETLLGEGSQHEKRTTALFVYDRSRLALIPVLSYQSGLGAPLPTDFPIPLGDGIAGAAFQQRRCIMWAAENPEISPFIHPHHTESAEDGTKLVAHLAIPVYHPSAQDEARPSPWSAIGVVSFGSSSMASRIPPLCDIKPNRLTQETIADARRFAQTHVQAILDAVRGA
jgi:predicted phosphodiesterase